MYARCRICAKTWNISISQKIPKQGYANKCVMEACGLAAKQDEEETVKNLKN